MLSPDVDVALRLLHATELCDRLHARRSELERQLQRESERRRSAELSEQQSFMAVASFEQDTFRSIAAVYNSLLLSATTTKSSSKDYFSHSEGDAASSTAAHATTMKHADENSSSLIGGPSSSAQPPRHVAPSSSTVRALEKLTLLVTDYTQQQDAEDHTWADQLDALRQQLYHNRARIQDLVELRRKKKASSQMQSQPQHRSHAVALFSSSTFSSSSVETEEESGTEEILRVQREVMDVKSRADAAILQYARDLFQQ